MAARATAGTVTVAAPEWASCLAVVVVADPLAPADDLPVNALMARPAVTPAATAPATALPYLATTPFGAVSTGATGAGTGDGGGGGVLLMRRATALAVFQSGTPAARAAATPATSTPVAMVSFWTFFIHSPQYLFVRKQYATLSTMAPRTALTLSNRFGFVLLFTGSGILSAGPGFVDAAS